MATAVLTGICTPLFAQTPAPLVGGAKPAQSASAAPTALANEQTLPNGTRVVHTLRGTGVKPTASDRVKVHYKGTLANGTEFDSSYKRNEPATFPLGGVIPCWTQGLQTMAEGGKATLTCPPEAAYGARGAGSAVPPNAVLTFQVELLAVLK